MKLTLNYPPIITLYFMGNFDHGDGMANKPHNLEPSYSRGGREGGRGEGGRI